MRYKTTSKVGLLEDGAIEVGYISNSLILLDICANEVELGHLSDFGMRSSLSMSNNLPP
jgi:hypothetical protein